VVAKRNNESHTGFMFKVPSVGDSRQVYYFRSGAAASKLAPSDLPLELLSDSRVFHVTGIFPSLSIQNCQTLQSPLRRAKKSGLIVSLDVNYRSVLWDREDARAVLHDLIKYVDIVFGDLEELNLLLDADAENVIDVLCAVIDLGPQEVILKQAELGATAMIDNQVWRQEIIEACVADTVGAGDAFVAGYLSGLLVGLPGQLRLKRAVACGALACQDLGDWEGALSRIELEKLLSSLPVRSLNEIRPPWSGFKIVPLVVIDEAEHVMPLMDALEAGGISIIEIGLRTPVALNAIRMAVNRGSFTVAAGAL